MVKGCFGPRVVVAPIRSKRRSQNREMTLEDRPYQETCLKSELNLMYVIYRLPFHRLQFSRDEVSLSIFYQPPNGEMEPQVSMI
jgi:hypothetical protein